MKLEKLEHLDTPSLASVYWRLLRYAKLHPLEDSDGPGSNKRNIRDGMFWAAGYIISILDERSAGQGLRRIWDRQIP